MTNRHTLLSTLASEADRDISISSLFEGEPDRLARFVMREGPLRADFSKQALDKKGLEALLDLAAKCDLEEWRAKLFFARKAHSKISSISVLADLIWDRAWLRMRLKRRRSKA